MLYRATVQQREEGKHVGGEDVWGASAARSACMLCAASDETAVGGGCHGGKAARLGPGLRLTVSVASIPEVCAYEEYLQGHGDSHIKYGRTQVGRTSVNELC